jgi:hypothetical protein
MFDLDGLIAEWRRQMVAGGIKDSTMLDELENHLREDVQQKVQSGLREPEAFATAVQQMGRAEVLKTEFAKVGGTVYERLKQFFHTLAGIPDYQLATNMNTSPPHIEPRWATYFKTTAFILPAVLLWAGSCVFVLPKLRDICAGSNTVIPKLMVTVLSLSDLFKDHLFVASVAILFGLIVLEWRSRWWVRHRRLVFGVVAFLLNSIALFLITTMFVLAVVAGANLLHAR